MHRQTLELRTERGRGTYEITDHIAAAIRASGVRDGLCTVFVHHTSASLVVNENADSDVRHDFESFLARLVPDGDPIVSHVTEGPDDMPAHVRSVLTLTSVTIPVANGRPDLGTWQGVFLWEHRVTPRTRRITITVF